MKWILIGLMSVLLTTASYFAGYYDWKFSLSHGGSELSDSNQAVGTHPMPDFPRVNLYQMKSMSNPTPALFQTQLQIIPQLSFFVKGTIEETIDEMKSRISSSLFIENSLFGPKAVVILPIPELSSMVSPTELAELLESSLIITFLDIEETGIIGTISNSRDLIRELKSETKLSASTYQIDQIETDLETEFSYILKNRMIKVRNLSSIENKKDLLTAATRYYEGRGYSLVPGNNGSGDRLLFEKGSGSAFVRVNPKDPAATGIHELMTIESTQGDFQTFIAQKGGSHLEKN
ncbi:MAG: hypothetical protein HRU19_08795 [Pseudobacteriovorax sp.]|nr:hypothetical protein [Pseudobacteriovorax sp.]